MLHGSSSNVTLPRDQDVLLFAGGLGGAGVRGRDKLGEALEEGARGVAAGAAAVRADAAAHPPLHHRCHRH